MYLSSLFYTDKYDMLKGTWVGVGGTRIAATATTGKLHWLRDPYREPGIGGTAMPRDGLEQKEGATWTWTWTWSAPCLSAGPPWREWSGAACTCGNVSSIRHV